MKIIEKLDSCFDFEFLTDDRILEDVWSKTNYKLIIEAMAVDPNAETMTDLKPVEVDDTPKNRDNRTGKKKGVRPIDTQDVTKTQEFDTQDRTPTEIMDVPNEFKDKLHKLLILAYKTSFDNFNRAKGKTAKSGYETIMHLANTIFKHIDQIKGPEQLGQVLQHVQNGRDRYVEVARNYQTFYNSLKNLA
jgi:hypothetical protein